MEKLPKSKDWIIKEAQLVTQIFTNHPLNARALIKDYFLIEGKDFDTVEKMFKEGEFKKHLPKKQRQHTKKQIEQIKLVGGFVNKENRCISIPLSVEIEEDTQQAIDKLKSYGYTLTQATF
jgi:ribosomal protein L15